MPCMPRQWRARKWRPWRHIATGPPGSRKPSGQACSTQCCASSSPRGSAACACNRPGGCRPGPGGCQSSLQSRPASAFSQHQTWRSSLSLMIPLFPVSHTFFLVHRSSFFTPDTLFLVPRSSTMTTSPGRWCTPVRTWAKTSKTSGTSWAAGVVISGGPAAMEAIRVGCSVYFISLSEQADQAPTDRTDPKRTERLMTLS